MTEVKLLVTLEVDGNTDEMATLFEQYLTTDDYPFMADYGPDAWGGYDGPYVARVTVERAT